MGEEVEQEEDTIVSENKSKESSMNLEKVYANVEPIDKALKADAVTNQQK